MISIVIEQTENGAIVVVHETSLITNAGPPNILTGYRVHSFEKIPSNQEGVGDDWGSLQDFIYAELNPDQGGDDDGD